MSNSLQIRDLTLLEKIRFFADDLRVMGCAMTGGHHGDWDCEDCFDRWNVGMACDHENLWRECSCGQVEFVRDGKPWSFSSGA